MKGQTHGKTFGHILVKKKIRRGRSSKLTRIINEEGRGSAVRLVEKAWVTTVEEQCRKASDRSCGLS